MDQQSEDLNPERVYRKAVNLAGLHLIFSSLKLKRWREMGRKEWRGEGRKEREKRGEGRREEGGKVEGRWREGGGNKVYLGGLKCPF